MSGAGAPPAAARPADPHSHARPAEARVTHLSLDLAVDFAARRLHGTVALDLAVAEGATEVVLDTQALRVHAVRAADGAPLAYALGDPDPVFGSALAVRLTPGTTRVVVEYETTAAGAGLLWLDAEQTAGGGQPYVFTQGHAILTRSWLPTQDAIGVRQSYDARITVPEGVRVVMSAEPRTPEGVPQEGGRRFEFRMPHPIPTYLVALAAGAIDHRATGPRTGVYAEPAVLERAAAEFAGLEGMLEAAERVAGPYRFERAEVLVLPPAFPFGGMENPRLTFASPTLIAGDRSLTTVVAHELAHSWAGNLVTPATWEDLWLNEGFTVYLELRVNELLHGAERVAVLEVYGHRELVSELARLGPASPDTRLHVELAGRDPAAALTSVPYVKGAMLLRALERAVGRERFDPWLRGWFARHAWRAVSAADFAADVTAALLTADEAAAFPLAEWLHAPGIPGGVPEPTSAVLAAIDAAAERYAAGAPLPEGAAGWIAQERRHFLNALPRHVEAARLAALDAALGLSGSANSEVLFAWLRLALRNEYAPALPAAERFLAAQGRGKFVRPLYAALAATPWGAPHARRIFAATRGRYHATVAAAVDALLADGPAEAR